MKWCEHIKPDKYQDYRFMQGMHQYIVPDFWGQCPVYHCGTPRPVSKKSLRDEIKDRMRKRANEAFSGEADYWEILADIAIQTIKEFKE